MIRLASILYSIVATTLAGIGVIAVLTAGYDTTVPIIVAAAIGAVVALPVSYLVARKITHLTSS
jgi:putative flippase GtrA